MNGVLLLDDVDGCHGTTHTTHSVIGVGCTGPHYCRPEQWTSTPPGSAKAEFS
jgi:hypothetical protein